MDEVRSVRDAIAKVLDYDIEKLAQAIKAHEARSGGKPVRLPPKNATIVHEAP